MPFRRRRTPHPGDDPPRRVGPRPSTAPLASKPSTRRGPQLVEAPPWSCRDQPTLYLEAPARAGPSDQGPTVGQAPALDEAPLQEQASALPIGVVMMRYRIKTPALGLTVRRAPPLPARCPRYRLPPLVVNRPHAAPYGAQGGAAATSCPRSDLAPPLDRGATSAATSRPGLPPSRPRVDPPAPPARCGGRALERRAVAGAGACSTLDDR